MKYLVARGSTETLPVVRRDIKYYDWALVNRRCQVFSPVAAVRGCALQAVSPVGWNREDVGPDPPRQQSPRESRTSRRCVAPQMRRIRTRARRHVRRRNLAPHKSGDSRPPPAEASLKADQNKTPLRRDSLAERRRCVRRLIHGNSERKKKFARLSGTLLTRPGNPGADTSVIKAAMF